MKVNRTDVLNKCNGRCGYCGNDLKGKFQIDHIIPQREFWVCIMNKWKIPIFLRHLTIADVNHIDNLMPACGSCNNYKSAKPLETFRSEISELVNRLNKRFTQYKIAKRYGLIQETNIEVKFYFETL